jgi:hypothetical protein
VIFRRCCFRRKQSNDEHQIDRPKRAHSGSLTTDISQINSKRKSSASTDVCRTIPKTENNLDTSPKAPVIDEVVVSFEDFLADTADDDDDEQSDSEFIVTSNEKTPTPT